MLGSTPSWQLLPQILEIDPLEPQRSKIRIVWEIELNPVASVECRYGAC
jgi:hypothetical protein